MHRLAFDTFDAVSFTLLFVITHKRTDHRQRIVGKDHLRCFRHLSVKKHPDHRRDRRMDRAPLHTSRFFAVQTSLRLVDHMQSHWKLLLSPAPRLSCYPDIFILILIVSFSLT